MITQVDSGRDDYFNTKKRRECVFFYAYKETVKA